MARIKILSEEQAQGPQRRMFEELKAAYGVVPGIAQILAVDSELAGAAFQIYRHLQFHPDSPLTRLQREMVATVVNGLIGGAP
jgi:hypothetical protein